MTDPHGSDLRRLEERACEARRPPPDDGLIVCDNLVRVYRTDEVEVHLTAERDHVGAWPDTPDTTEQPSGPGSDR